MDWRINDKWIESPSSYEDGIRDFPDKIYNKNKLFFNYRIRFVIYPTDHYVTIYKMTIFKKSIFLSEDHYLHAYKKWYKLFDKFLGFLIGSKLYVSETELLKVKETKKKYN